MKCVQDRWIILAATAAVLFFGMAGRAAASDVSLTLNASAEEQQTIQAGLVFNNAVFGQAFPTAPNYFVSTRVTAGRRISYLATVTNVDAVNPSPNVAVAFTFPSGTQLYQGSLIASTGACQATSPANPNGTLICDLGTLAASAAGTVTFQLIVASDTPAGTVLLTGATASISGDTNLANNFATTQNTVLSAADISVALATIGTQSSFSAAQGRIIDTTALNSVTAGNLVLHRVEVQNNGPSHAATTLIKHTLPAGFVFASAVGARCIPAGSASNVVFCALSDVEAGSREAYDLYVAVDPFTANLSNLQSCISGIGSVSNTVPPGGPPSVVFDPPLQPIPFEPLNANNDSCTSTGTGVLVDAGVSFDEASFSADEHGAVHYTPVVQNDGRSGMLAATLTVTFPQGLTPRGASNGCVIGASTATCTVAPLSPGESQSFDVVGSVELVSASVSALAVNAALSGINPADVNSANNTASAVTVVQPRFDDTGPKVALSVASSDFDIQSGTWGVNNRGNFFSFELGTARALVKSSKLARFDSGTLQAAIRLLRFKKSNPNASIVFAHQSDKNYRFVRLEKRGRRGRVVLGQSGSFGGEGAGFKAVAKFPLKLGRVYNVSVQVFPDGTVSARINNSSRAVASYKFAEGPIAGRTGVETRKARAVYDRLSVLAD